MDASSGARLQIRHVHVHGTTSLRGKFSVETNRDETVRVGISISVGRTHFGLKAAVGSGRRHGVAFDLKDGCHEGRGGVELHAFIRGMGLILFFVCSFPEL